MKAAPRELRTSTSGAVLDIIVVGEVFGGFIYTSLIAASQRFEGRKQTHEEFDIFVGKYFFSIEWGWLAS